MGSYELVVAWNVRLYDMMLNTKLYFHVNHLSQFWFLKIFTSAVVIKARMLFLQSSDNITGYPKSHLLSRVWHPNVLPVGRIGPTQKFRRWVNYPEIASLQINLHSHRQAWTILVHSRSKVGKVWNAWRNIYMQYIKSHPPRSSSLSNNRLLYKCNTEISVEVIRSDNGTNLVGAEAELRREIVSWNQSLIGRMLQQDNVQWIFNPPAASHFGGFYERLILSVRKVLYGLLTYRAITLDDESLHTILCEVEQILNSRPLTTSSDDINDLEALTPNHLLMDKSNSTPPPGIFTSSDNYVRRQWRQAQHLTNLFWTRWTREYLPTLQVRQKWIRPHRNVAAGDVCLVKANTPRYVGFSGESYQS